LIDLQTRAKFTQEQIGEMNKVKIIRLIKNNKEVTKSELSTKLGLSHTTVNTYVQKLIDEGLVERAGVAASNGGRKPMIVKLVAEAKYSFGVSITPKAVYILLVNLLGDKVVSTYFSYRKGDELEKVLNKLKYWIEQIICVNGLDRNKIMGMGMVFPGVVDDDECVLKYSPNLNVRNYDFKRFEENIGLKIYVENEANAAAYAEQLLGKGRDKGNFVYVSIGDGIGTGIIIDKHIYKGNQKKAGEFGHLKISEEKIKCNCGRTGCWELFASKMALLRYFEEYTQQKIYLIEQVFMAYQQGDTGASQALEKYAHYLFRGLENILLSVNPDYVIIGGDLGQYAQQIIEIAVEKLHFTDRFFGYENTKIYCSGLHAEGAVIGAALLPLEAIFNYQKNVI